MKKRQFSSEYKLKIVLEVLKEELTLSGICARESLAIPMVSGSKRDFLTNASTAFSTNKQDSIAEAVAI